MSKEPIDISGLSPDEQASLAAAVMKRQATLSLRVAIVCIAMLIGLPLFNLYAHDLANTRVMGFTLTWLLLGIVFFPVTWLLSAYFIHASDQLEADVARTSSLDGTAGKSVSALDREETR